MLYTYAFLDLPDLPESIIDSARKSLEKHHGQLETKVNNWLDKPGYKEYEYRSFNMPDGSKLKTIKSHRYPISEEFDDWVIKYFKQDPSSCGIAYYDNHSSLFAPHVDISRDYTVMYLLDLGGENVDTIWYQQKGYPILRPDLKAEFDPKKTVNSYDDLVEIDRACFPLRQWVCINSAILHGVQNIQSTRIAVQISRNTPLQDIRFRSVSKIK